MPVGDEQSGVDFAGEEDEGFQRNLLVLGGERIGGVNLHEVRADHGARFGEEKDMLEDHHAKLVWQLRKLVVIGNVDVVGWMRFHVVTQRKARDALADLELRVTVVGQFAAAEFDLEGAQGGRDLELEQPGDAVHSCRSGRCAR